MFALKKGLCSSPGRTCVFWFQQHHRLQIQAFSLDLSAAATEQIKPWNHVTATQHTAHLTGTWGPLSGDGPSEGATRTEETGSEGSVLRRWRCCRTPLLHRHPETETERKHKTNKEHSGWEISVEMVVKYSGYYTSMFRALQIHSNYI